MTLSNEIFEILNFVLLEWKLVIILTFIFSIYFNFVRTFGYFESKGIKYIEPRIFDGGFWDKFVGKIPFHEQQLNIYSHFKGEPFGGAFEGHIPVLYILDPELIKTVLNKDFEYFSNQALAQTRQPRFLNRSIVNLKGTDWKEVRSTISPTFSSARLKSMFPLIEGCAKQMVDYMKKYDGKHADVKELAGRFTLEVIGVCAFGISSDVLLEDDAQFFATAKKFNELNESSWMFRYLVFLISPTLMAYLAPHLNNVHAANQLKAMLEVTIKERRLSKTKRSDFLQLLLDAAENELKENKPNMCLDDDTIIGQCIIFIIAGYDTFSTLLLYTLYSMALYPEVQDRVRDHIKEKIQEKELNYEILMETDYLDGCLMETLRLYTPLPRLTRACTKKYKIPNTRITINPGKIISIPIYGIHMDADYFPEPTEFRPERFMGEEKENSHIFMPFGSGPRYCIGKRLSMLAAKIAMVYLMKNYRFSTGPKTEIPPKVNKRRTTLTPENGITLYIDSLHD